MTSDDIPNIFLRDEPDWTGPVLLKVNFLTAIGKNFIGGEQQTGMTGRPKLTLSYSLTGLDRRLWSVRRAQGHFNNIGPVVCPIWTIKPVTTSVSSFGRPLTDLLFYPGSYAYHLEADAFYRITTFSGEVLILDGYPAINTGQTLIPCVTGSFHSTANHAGLDSTSENISIIGF